jgi:hypothetical protein
MPPGALRSAMPKRIDPRWLRPTTPKRATFRALARPHGPSFRGPRRMIAPRPTFTIALSSSSSRPPGGSPSGFLEGLAARYGILAGVRNLPGVTPTWRLKRRENWLWSAKPAPAATSARKRVDPAGAPVGFGSGALLLQGRTIGPWQIPGGRGHYRTTRWAHGTHLVAHARPSESAFDRSVGHHEAPGTSSLPGTARALEKIASLAGADLSRLADLVEQGLRSPR